MSENILVTGGTGFIGSHTLVALMTAGFTPLSIDNLINIYVTTLDRIAARPVFYAKDLHNEEVLAEGAWAAGKRQHIVNARCLLCYWAIQELGIFLPAICKSVVRGK